MLAGGFREEGSGVPSGVAEAVERLCSSRERTASTGTLGPGGDRFGEGSSEEAGVLLELEDIARERCGRLCVVMVPMETCTSCDEVVRLLASRYRRVRMEV